MRANLLATRSEERLLPDPSRVVAYLFVAGQEIVGRGESRTYSVVGRILALDEVAVKRRLGELLQRFGPRHPDLVGTFRHHADRIGNRLDSDEEFSEERWLLLGATFTHEYAVEAAALCNPSIVEHPDQSSTPGGALRFVMSVRGIGEGHRSSIGFRTGTVSDSGAVTVDEPKPFPTLATVKPGVFARDALNGRLNALGEDGERAAHVLDNLADDFTADELESQLGILAGEHHTKRYAHTTASLLRSIVACSYNAHFSAHTHVSERVLSPAMAAESHGMEDARFVRFTDDDSSVTFYATYTAFDGIAISQQLLQTSDFVSFSTSPLTGPAAANNGLALFPRRIGGRFAALSRHDRESNAVAFSDTLAHWEEAVTFQVPERDWEGIQLGNCGSPIETDEGWLVLTHGVGPMRTYSIGAMLLDLDDPTTVLATLPEPLLTADADEQDGYVPNVVYSCGALLHGPTLVIPYGIADTSIGIATVPWTDLLDEMVPIA
jgi:predicted GH43/DUF377 family glycosyl hydrolase